MTTDNEATEAIYQRFLDNFTGVVAGNIDFDNEKFEPAGSGAWVRLTVRGRSRVQDTLGKTGNRRFRSAKSVFVQVYTDIDTGVQQADILGAEARDVFEGVSFSGLDFGNAFKEEKGPDGKWYEVLVEAEFEYDEIK